MRDSGQPDWKCGEVAGEFELKGAYLDAIRAYADSRPTEPWVLGDGWYMEAFPGGTPAKEDLDRVVPDRAAFFVNRDGHGAWLNSRALEPRKLKALNLERQMHAHGRAVAVRVGIAGLVEQRARFGGVVVV